MEVLYASSHLAGDFPNAVNAVGNTPGIWAGDLNANTSYTSRWAISDTVDPLTASATQTVRVVARKGSNSGTPTIALNLYENGVLVQSILAATNVTSTTGQTFIGTFNSAAVTNPANVEIEVVQTSAGGNPSVRNCAQISHIEWTADTSVAVPDPAEGSGSITGLGGLFAVGQITVEGAGAVTGVGSLTGDGSAPGVVGAEGFGSITALGGLEASGQIDRSGFGEITTTGDLTGDGQVPGVPGAGGAGQIASLGVLTGDGFADMSAEGAILGVGGLFGDGSAPVIVDAGGSGSISAVGVLTAAGDIIHYGVSAINGVGELVGAAGITAPMRPVPYARRPVPFTPTPVPYS